MINTTKAPKIRFLCFFKIVENVLLKTFPFKSIRGYPWKNSKFAYKFAYDYFENHSLKTISPIMKSA